MAFDIFLKLDGIKGEAMDKVHHGEIDVLGWSWSGSQPVAMGGGGLGSGKANFTNLVVTKYIDISSPSLMRAMLSGKHIATGTLTMRKTGADPLEYLVYNFTEIVVASVNTGATDASAGADRMTEQVGLAFESFIMTYREQADTGAGAGKSVLGWSFAKNAAL